jgi:hypothetical protein
MAASRFRPDGIALGLGCLGFGVLALLANLGYVDLLKAVRLFWPLVLVAWGLAELINTFSAGRTP